MENAWYRVGTRGFWAAVVIFCVALELLLRLKIGTLFVIVGFWALAHQWLALRLDHPLPKRDVAGRLMFALYTSLIAGASAFAAVSVVNIALRSVNEGWRWFQLP